MEFIRDYMIYNSKMSKINSVIILAGGSSIRMKTKTPKQFLSIKNDIMVIEHSINIFKNCSEINEIILVCHKDWFEKIKHDFGEICKVVIGGNTRSDSSLQGLLNCNKLTENVLIHDSARPYISKKIINDCLKNLDNYDASIPVINTSDSLINVENNKIIYLNRDNIKMIQTPQGFKYQKILEALKNKQKNYLDDLSALLDYSSKTNYILFDGDKKNFKITNKEDLELARKISNEI